MAGRVEFRVTMEGAKEGIIYFDEAIERANNMLPVMEEIFTDMLHAEAALFRSQGRRGGGSWKPLAESTVRQKGSTQILEDTGDLLESLTVRDHPLQAKDITASSVGLGTRRPWWYVHQYGSTRVPKRPFLRFARYDIDKWNKMISDFLVRGKDSGKRGRTHG